MIQINKSMPNCCNECFAFDDNGDYPFCLITRHSRGYRFNVRANRMPDCPLIARPKARWILSTFQNEEDNANNNYQYNCSNCDCGDVHVKGFRVPYCWHCGAEMEYNNG